MEVNFNLRFEIVVYVEEFIDFKRSLVSRVFFFDWIIKNKKRFRNEFVG